MQLLATKDLNVEAVAPRGGAIDGGAGVGFTVAMISAIQVLQVVPENGALRAMVSLANRGQFGALPEEVVEKTYLDFYGDVDRAAMKEVEG